MYNPCENTYKCQTVKTAHTLSKVTNTLRKVAQIFAKNGAYVACVRVPDACVRKTAKTF